MTTPFAASLSSNFATALGLLDAALADCPAHLWHVDLWAPEPPTRPTPPGGLHGSAPWFLGYHALTCLDYDLSGDFAPWAPPPPLDEATFGFPTRAFTPSELRTYLEYCRHRVEVTLDSLTDQAAARPLPDSHRARGVTYGVLVGGIPGHVVEHASQIRQFLTSSGVTVRPMPGDWGYDGAL